MPIGCLFFYEYATYLFIDAIAASILPFFKVDEMELKSFILIDKDASLTPGLRAKHDRNKFLLLTTNICGHASPLQQKKPPLLRWLGRLNQI